MAEVVLAIKRWGNNLGVRLPAAVARAAKLSVDQRVRVSVEEGRVVITPIAGGNLSFLALSPSFEARRRRPVRGSVRGTEPDHAIELASNVDRASLPIGELM
jgi:antitoxin MazE